MPMNRGLFTVCLVLKVVEQSGHGVPIIVEKYGKEAYDFSSDSIVVTLKFPFKFRGVLSNDDNQLTSKKLQRNPKETLKKNPKEKPQRKTPKKTNRNRYY